MKDKPYPRKCPNCRERSLLAAVEDTTAELRHDGDPYTVTVPQLEVQVCTSCEVRNWPYEASERVTDALRVSAGILMPAEILAARLRLGATPGEIAAHLGVLEAVYSRWESGGQLQSRMQDFTLRVYFANPDRFLRARDWPREPVALPHEESLRFLDLKPSDAV